MEESQLTREGGTGPSWVGDDKLLFAHGDAVCQIGVDGLGLAKVAEVSGSTVFRPSLSPRGNTILFSSRTYGGRASYSVHRFCWHEAYGDRYDGRITEAKSSEARRGNCAIGPRAWVSGRCLVKRVDGVVMIAAGNTSTF